MKKVILAEKPSVAKNIADALGNQKRNNGYIETDDYIITWAFGHLVQLYDMKDYNKAYEKWKLENFPFIPKTFKYKTSNDSQKQINIIKNLINQNDVDEVIIACDNDREGQIIGDSILRFIGNKKPETRLLLNEWTKDEVLDGLKKRKSNKDMINLSNAGFSRQHIDWLLGINLTTVATLKSEIENRVGPLRIGRVLLPTLYIIYSRDKEIEQFKPEKYHKILVDYSKNNMSFSSSYFLNGTDKFKDKDKTKEIKKKISGGKKFEVVDVKKEKKKENSPSLFNLSALQGHITSKYSGFTSELVLNTCQSLYENKFITYPRTDSSFLDESLIDKTKKVFDNLSKNHPHKNLMKFSTDKRIFNSKKVEGHSAIIPTYLIPQESNLTKNEKIVYEEIKNRFLSQFMPPYEYEETIVSIKIDDLEGECVAKGKVEINSGFKVLFQSTNTKSKTTDIMLPNLNKNDLVDLLSVKVKDFSTTPPQHHTEKTLLRFMETCGKSVDEKGGDSKGSDELMASVLKGFSIGTPATRANTIEKLKESGYVYQKGKSLYCSELGAKLVEDFPVKNLFDLEYTGKLEKTLKDIELGLVKKEELMEHIIDFTKKSVEEIKKNGGIIMRENDEDILGVCPECGNVIVENERSYGCLGWKNGCNFNIWKEDFFFKSLQLKLTPEIVRELLSKGEVFISGAVSKKGNVFDAYYSYKKDPQTQKYSWSLRFPEKND